MQLSPGLKNKKLHINSLLIAKNVIFHREVKTNAQSHQNQNPQAQSSPQSNKNQLHKRSYLTFEQNTLTEKYQTKYLPSKYRIDYFAKQMKNLGEINGKNQHNQINSKKGRIQTQENIPQKDLYPNTAYLKKLTRTPKQKTNDLEQNRRQKKKCLSSQNNQCKSFQMEQETIKNLSFRKSFEQICQNSRNSSANYKRLQFFSYEHSPSSNLNSLEKLTRVTSILKLYPNKSNNIRRNRKETVMNKYDYECENIRLAQKILKMKPSKLCDIKEQMRFFKKQRYFKELRSCSIDSKEDSEHLDLISQSVSLPRINERYHTLNC